MKKLQFKKEISATAQKVYETMLGLKDKSTYEHCLSPLNSWTKFGKQFCNNLNLGYEKHQAKIYS